MKLKDGGHGVTDKSLEYWRLNRQRIGDVTSVLVTAEPLLVEQASTGNYDVEYNLKIEGTEGTIFLSGCNCGYGGTGPNGTAKILCELGIPSIAARKAMLGKKIEYSLSTDTLIIDGEQYSFPMADLRRETMAYDELLYEIDYERARETLEEMKNARYGDDGEFE